MSKTPLNPNIIIIINITTTNTIFDVNLFEMTIKLDPAAMLPRRFAGYNHDDDDGDGEEDDVNGEDEDEDNDYDSEDDNQEQSDLS